MYQEVIKTSHFFQAAQSYVPFSPQFLPQHIQNSLDPYRAHQMSAISFTSEFFSKFKMWVLRKRGPHVFYFISHSLAKIEAEKIKQLLSNHWGSNQTPEFCHAQRKKLKKKKKKKKKNRLNIQYSIRMIT